MISIHRRNIFNQKPFVKPASSMVLIGLQLLLINFAIRFKVKLLTLQCSERVVWCKLGVTAVLGTLRWKCLWGQSVDIALCQAIVWSCLSSFPSIRVSHLDCLVLQNWRAKALELWAFESLCATQDVLIMSNIQFYQNKTAQFYHPNNKQS